MSEHPEMSDAARRGLQRAGVHLIRAVIEVVNGISAFLEELQTARESREGEPRESDRHHIPVE
jgi:hypothetical protein